MKLMKRAPSDLIAEFLHHVEQGDITGKGDPASPSSQALQHIVNALRAIRDGIPPDIALEVRRQTGPEPRDRLARMETAWRFHELRQRGEKEETAAALVNEWRVEYGIKPLSLSGMKTLYRELLPAIERAEKFAIYEK